VGSDCFSIAVLEHKLRQNARPFTKPFGTRPVELDQREFAHISLTFTRKCEIGSSMYNITVLALRVSCRRDPAARMEGDCARRVKPPKDKRGGEILACHSALTVSKRALL